jgi:hypothetical protein
VAAVVLRVRLVGAAHRAVPRAHHGDVRMKISTTI